MTLTLTGPTCDLAHALLLAEAPSTAPLAIPPARAHGSVGNVMVTGSRLCINSADDGGAIYLEAVDSIVIKETALAAIASAQRGENSDARQGGVSADGNVSWLNNTQGCD